MSWDQYVQAMQQLGFTKVTIINRANYQTIAMSSQADVATAYMDGDVQVNENQELLDEWKDAKKNVFRFYGTKFNIIQRDLDNGDWIVANKGQMVCLAYQFKTIWFIVAGEMASRQVKKAEDGDDKPKATFKSAPDAFNQAMSKVWDALVEAGI